MEDQARLAYDAGSMNSTALLPAAPLRMPALIAACLAATWLIWGSTYLAIKWALVSFPPFYQIDRKSVV